jgi:glycerophosphoryl diester phosphodiesterase
MAHRGNRVDCPENTLAAFRQAFADGADLLETDLHLSRDGVFMCIHDETLERTTNGHGKVAKKTLAELKQLSASYGRPEFAAERIPTLAETAAILPTDAALALELKTDRFLQEEICQQLVDELTRLGIRDRVVVISFNAERVQAVQRAAPDIAAGFITLSRPWPVKDVQLLGPFWPLLILNPLYPLLARRRGQVVCPLDPTPDSRLWWYRLLRVDALLTDNPRKTIQLLRRKSGEIKLEGE